MRHPFFPRKGRGVLAVALAIAGLLSAPAARATTPGHPVPLLDWQKGWKPFQGMHFKYDSTGAGVFSCYSLNGRTCSSASPITSGADYPIPLECRADGPIGDLCERAYAATFARWFNYGALGHRGRLSKSLQGHAMCESYDGRNCEWNVQGDQLSAPDRIRPLLCGPKHQAQWGGISGYDRVGHWCSTPEIVQRNIDVTLEAGRPVVLPMPSWYHSLTHPGWIVRAEVPQGGELTVQTQVQAEPFPRGPQDEDVELIAGYVAGSASRPFFQLPDGRVLRPHVTRFTPPRPAGALTIALRVGTAGNFCFQHTAGFNDKILDSAAVSDGWKMLESLRRPELSAVTSSMTNHGAVPGPWLLLRSTTDATVKDLIAIQSREIPWDGGRIDHTGLVAEVSCPGFL